MDKPQLQTLIQTSSVLAEVEKTYWLENLSKLNKEQCAELAMILTNSEEETNEGVDQVLQIPAPVVQTAFQNAGRRYAA